MGFNRSTFGSLIAAIILSGCSAAPEQKRNFQNESKTTCPGYTKPMLVPVDKYPDSYIIYPEQRKDTIYKEKK